MVKVIVRIPPNEAEKIIERAVTSSGMSVNQVASHRNAATDGKEVILLVYDKYYMRNSSRASLSVLIENIDGSTNVIAVGSGGSQGAIFNFDWGTANNFEKTVFDAMQPYA